MKWFSKKHKINQATYTGAFTKPARSLRLKAFCVVFTLVLSSTALCGLFAGWLATSTLEKASLKAIDSLSNNIQRLVVPGIMQPNTNKLKSQSDQIMIDSRISFLVIESPNNKKTIHQAFNHPVDWHTYTSQISPQLRQQAIGLNKTHKIVTPGNRIIHIKITPLWNDSNHNKKIVGYLTLAIHDETQIALLSNLYTAILGLICVIGLIAIPAVAIWTYSWVKPIRKLLLGTLQLGMGQVFEPIIVKRNDEIGMLGRSFNAMGENLCAIQNALVRSNEMLEEKVHARTLDLEQAKIQLEQEARDKDDFIRTVSHDLNAPLRNILGMSEKLLQKYEADLTDDAIKKLKRIAANAKEESALLSDLLEISRLKTIPGKDQKVDLNLLLNAVTNSLTDDLEQQNITLEIQHGLPFVNADRMRLKQVFQNLIDNAIKYMPQDRQQKCIHVGTTMQNDQVVFYVKDNGRGISQKDSKRIFQLFQRARYSGQNPQTDSRGVGLSNVKTIIEAYAGEIWLQSQLDRGTTFFFTLDPQRVQPNLQCLSDQLQTL